MSKIASACDGPGKECTYISAHTWDVDSEPWLATVDDVVATIKQIKDVCGTKVGSSSTPALGNFVIHVTNKWI